MAPLTLPTIKRFRNFSFYPEANTVEHRSPYDQSADTVAFPGMKWRLRATLPPMREDEGGEEWAAFLASLEGAAGRFYAGDGRRIAPRGPATTIAARRNDIPNSAMNGAVVGTLGSGGSLPTGWSFAAGGGGFSVDVVAIGVEAGIEYIDLRAYAPTAVSSSSISLCGITDIAGVLNDPKALSAYMRLAAGATTNVQVGLRHTFYDSGQVGLTSSLQDVTSSITSGALETNRLSFLDTVDEATAAYSRPVIRFNALATTTPDVTVRIGIPQDEPETSVSDPVRTFGAARSVPAGPFVEFAGQTGKTLNIGGWSPSQAAGLLLIGDYCSYDLASGNRTLHKLTADLGASDISGVAPATVIPPILESPADLAPIALSPATCIMHLVNDEQAEVPVDVAGFYRVAFEAEEIFDGLVGS